MLAVCDKRDMTQDSVVVVVCFVYLLAYIRSICPDKSYKAGWTLKTNN